MNMLWRCAAAWLLAGFVSASQAQGLPPELQSAWKATRLPDAALSLEIREAGGPVVASLHSQVPRNPASVMKLVTTWAALSTLGPDFVWRTRFLADAKARLDAQGTLSGPLYIQAAGDPWFTLEDLWHTLRELRVRGVKNVSEVVVDRRLFGDVAIDPGEFDAQPDRAYNASPDALLVGFGATRVLFYPDRTARQWIPILDPPLRGVQVQGRVEWLNGACKARPVVTAQVMPQAGRAVVQVSGKASGECGEFSLYRLVGTPVAHFESLFRLLWKELGGTLARGIRSGAVPGDARELVGHDSPTLASTIGQINKYSNNVMARMTLLTLGTELDGPGATATGSARAVGQVLAGQGVDTAGWVLDNGSGLSREARVTARGLAQMLDVAWRSPLMPEYVASLAISGVDGTVRRRLKDAQTRGQAHLKTGTLRDARALAGYVRGASGKYYILVSMVNDGQAAQVRAFDDAVVRWLAAR
ncbi:D-alanyl-D-alanine carboxypeptidase/D-alanyl-D-alanine-endopeptidase [Castellaniella sp.]|uniref:D-alanyl-D-alanine carboxypeptidase/D-alanyl-D-alanine endopeptidase n=1 Tax=Castellaniella sp. TaxID=1955812 RepID=UPI0035640452